MKTIKHLEKENSELKAENKRLRGEIEDLKDEILYPAPSQDYYDEPLDPWDQ